VRVEWLPVAERNRESQLAYIGERNLWAAIDMGDAIEAAVRHLVDNPHMGRLGRAARQSRVIRSSAALRGPSVTPQENRSDTDSPSSATQIAVSGTFPPFSTTPYTSMRAVTLQLLFFTIDHIR